MFSLPRLLRAAARRKKNLLTWILVSHSSLLKSRLLLSSFAFRISEATCVGSALSPVFIQYQTLLLDIPSLWQKNLVAPRRGVCSAHPSGSSHVDPALLLAVASLLSAPADFFTWSTVQNF